VRYGDRIKAEGELSYPRAFETGEGRVFAYDEFLALTDVRYLMSFASIDMIKQREGLSLMATALSLKRWFLDGLGLSLPEPHAGLAGGITVGDKRGLGEALSSTFQTTGLSHIVVLSGYNIMIVLVFLERLLRAFGARVHLVLAVIVALFFVLMTGFASASVRAACMAIIAVIGRMTGRTYLALRALVSVAVIMLIFEPHLLFYDPGFQLSIVATWGLIVIAPLIEVKLTRVTKGLDLRAILASTIGTQIAVLPLLLYQTGILSFVSLPANMLVLPIVPMAMLASFVAGFFGALVGPLAPIVGAPAYVLLQYMITAADTLAALPFAHRSIPPFPVSLLSAVYAVLVTVAHVRTARQQRSN
jgi:competence protein ComEC